MSAEPPLEGGTPAASDGRAAASGEPGSAVVADADRAAQSFADAIVVAAGTSRRMAGTDKLTADLGGRPVLWHAVDAVRAARSVRHVVLVVAPERLDAVRTESWVAADVAAVVAGGARRQDSVLRGIAASDADVVLVHDGARPLVPPGVVDRVALAARAHGAAIPVVSVADSLKRVTDGGIAAVDRDGLVRAQTPQGARRELLLEAYDRAGGERAEAEHGDEASVLTAAGFGVVTVAGDPSNVKLTEPADLELARAIVTGRTGEVRYGTATDTHPFGPGTGLMLGGVSVPLAPRLAGHSDGDVALHAIADAMLGAAALPDLGRQFPASDPQTAGIASDILLRTVVERVSAAGWRPSTVDLSIIGARPRLGSARLEAMRTTIASILGLPLDRIAVKASTGNLAGAEGAGRVISATALVGLVRG